MCLKTFKIWPLNIQKNIWPAMGCAPLSYTIRCNIVQNISFCENGTCSKFFFFSLLTLWIEEAIHQTKISLGVLESREKWDFECCKLLETLIRCQGLNKIWNLGANCNCSELRNVVLRLHWRWTDNVEKLSLSLKSRIKYRKKLWNIIPLISMILSQFVRNFKYGIKKTIFWYRNVEMLKEIQ